MSEDTNGSAATGMQELQKMLDLKMTLVSSNSIVLACQKMKVEAKEQEDLLEYVERPAEEENIKLDGSGDRGKEANLHSDCERALQNLVLGRNPTHSMKINRDADVFGYRVRSGVEDEVYEGPGGMERENAPSSSLATAESNNQCRRNHEETEVEAAAKSIPGGDKERLSGVLVANVPRYEVETPAPAGLEYAPAPDPGVVAETRDGNNPFMRSDEETEAAVDSILSGEDERVNQVFVVNVPRYEVETPADVLALF